MAGKEITELLKSLKDEIMEFRGEFQGFSMDTKQKMRELWNDVKELKGTVGDLKIQQVEEKQRLSAQALSFLYNKSNSCRKGLII